MSKADPRTLGSPHSGTAAGPLGGRRILITRPENQAQELVARVRALGGEPVLCPTVRIVPPLDTGPLDRAIEHLTDYDWVIFTSVNGVRFFFEQLTAGGYDATRLSHLQVGAIGPATAEALAGHGLPTHFMPGKYVAEAVVAEIGDVSGKRILLPRADIARKALTDGLQTKGASVDEVVAYQTIPATGMDGEQARRLIQDIDIATFTSPSTVHNFVALFDDLPPVEILGPTLVACIGPITARAAVVAGFRVEIMAAEHTIPGLVAAILHYLKEQD